jgi:Tol biopolymer transport system component
MTEGSRIVSISPDGSNRKEIIDGLLFAAPRSGKMVFINPKDTSLCVSSTDGSGVVRIAEHFRYDIFQQAALSPDGSRIVFIDRSNGAATHPAAVLVVMNTDGTGRRELSNRVHHESTPSFSPDGSRIAFAAVDRNIYVIDQTGSDLKALTASPIDTSLIVPSFSGVIPQWSPQGDRIVVLSPASGLFGIVVLRADTVNRGSYSLDGDYPIWSPDGRKIALVGMARYASKPRDIVVADEVLINEKSLPTLSGEEVYNLQWSPDGGTILYGVYGQAVLGPMKRVDINSGEVTVLSTFAINGFWVP